MSDNIVAKVQNSESSTLFVAAGFEDRCLGYLRLCRAARTRYARVVVIEYKPFNERNRSDEVHALARAVSDDKPHTITFDRYDPGGSEDCEAASLGVAAQNASCVLDISGMSRFLIVILVARLHRLGLLSNVIYTEPELYAPTREEYLSAVPSPDAGMETLLCQTTGLYGLSAVPDMTTAVMQGSPELLVASPTFDPRFMRALLTEVAPAKLVLLEGIPTAEERKWRVDAVRALNSFAFSIADGNVNPISTGSIDETCVSLKQVYEKHKYTHRMVVAPAASKLSAVGVALSITGPVEAEVLYPTPIGFSDPYTVGIGGTSIFSIVPEKAE